MCKWIAGEILGSFLRKTSQKETIIVTATEGAGDKLDNAGFPVSKPEGRKLVGGMGEPRFCHTRGNQGLCMTEQVWLRWALGCGETYLVKKQFLEDAQGKDSAAGV